ncbi:MAG: hypothetical protein AAFN04_00150 [Pseudomonadota bacterium]
MTLEDFYFISQIVAAVGIMLSLIFVGLQMRAQTRETRLASMAEIMAEYRDVMVQTSNNRDLIEIVMRAEEVGISQLDETDRFRLSLSAMAILRVFEQAHIYRCEGRIDDPTWASMEGIISTTFVYRFCTDYFDARRITFTPAFVEYVEREFGGLLEERRAGDALPVPASQEIAQ